MTPDDSTPRGSAAVAARWVERRRAGLNTAAERELAAWLAAAPENAAALARLEAMAAVFVRARAQGAAPAITDGVRKRAARRQRRGAALAAAALVVCVGGLLFHRGAESAPVAASATARATPDYGDFRQRLPDGSIVEARPGAAFTVAFEPDVRRIALVRGEAWFQVEPDASRPFIVEAAGVSVRAVGTAFHVRIEAESIGVLVTEGRVRVDDAAHETTLLPPIHGESTPVLVAGQEAVLPRRGAGATAASVATVATGEMHRRLAWRALRLSFDGMELGRAVAMFNRTNRTQLVLADASLAGLRISGDFEPRDPELFARLAAATFGLRLQREGPDRLLLARE